MAKAMETKSGRKIIMSVIYKKDPHLLLTLCRWDRKPQVEWVVWDYNLESKGFCNGNYYTTFEDALKQFMDKKTRQYHDGQPIIYVGDKFVADEEAVPAITISLAKRKNDWKEYKVVVRVDGKVDQDACYFTEDWDDAVSTMEIMKERAGI